MFPYVGLCKLIIRPLPPKWTPLHFLVWVVWQEDVANAPSPATTIPGGTHEALVNLTMCSSIKLFTYHILIAHTDITYWYHILIRHDILRKGGCIRPLSPTILIRFGFLVEFAIIIYDMGLGPNTPSTTPRTADRLPKLHRSQKKMISRPDPSFSSVTNVGNDDYIYIWL